MIDWDRVAELRGEIGPEDFIEVVALFLDEVEAVLRQLRDAPGPPRPASIADDLHFLKGSALNLGFARFGALCGEGERQAASGAADAVAIDGIVACYEASRQSFLGSDLVRAIA